MKKLFFILMVIALGTTACSKKSSGGSAPQPPPVNPPPVNPPPASTSFDLTADGIKLNVLTQGIMDMGSRSAYKKFLRTALRYQAYKSSDYGTDASYDYDTTPICDTDLLDRLYYKFGYDFTNCTHYNNELNYLTQSSATESGEGYLQIKQTAGNLVEGVFHATVYDSFSNYYYIEHSIPFKGKIVKNQVNATTFFYSIEIGGLYIYTMDNTVMNPSFRELTVDTSFDGNFVEMGYFQLHN